MTESPSTLEVFSGDDGSAYPQRFDYKRLFRRGAEDLEPPMELGFDAVFQAVYYSAGEAKAAAQVEFNVGDEEAVLSATQELARSSYLK